MNNKLKKKSGKQSDYQKKYMKKHKMISLNLDKTEDKDIISWLGKQKNRSEAIRQALREAIVWTESHKTDV